MNRNNDIKKLTMAGLLIAIGAVLHQITPAIGLPMQPDMSLIMLFIILILNKGDYKISLISGLATGIFTAMTTKFPGGQIPNFLDKIITTHIMFFMVIFLDSLVYKLKNTKGHSLISVLLFPLGTLISGTIFLISAQLIAGLPAPFMALFMTVVVPATFVNTLVGMFLLKLTYRSLRISANS